MSDRQILIDALIEIGSQHRDASLNIVIARDALKRYAASASLTQESTPVASVTAGDSPVITTAEDSPVFMVGDSVASS
jgi:hypothetical protein